MTSTTVHQAIAAVMGELGGIGKDAKSPQGYSYRGIEAITKEIRPLLAKHGVVIVPRAEVFDTRACAGMKEGWQDTYMNVEWTIVGPDGSRLDASTVGIGRDNSDKGANKAMTQAYKYLLLDLFAISDAADDADGLSYEDHTQERSPAPVTDIKSRTKAKVKLASRPDHDEVIALVRDLKEPEKEKFREWYKAQVAVNGFPEGGLSNRLLNDEQLASCKSMALEIPRPLTHQEIQEAFDAADDSEAPFA